MKQLARVVAFAVALGLAPLAVTATAHADTPVSQAVQDCLIAHPGAVIWDQVTEGDDSVCVDQMVRPSPGNDTYIWVGAEQSTEKVSALTTEAPGQILDDPGSDTVSLVDWTFGYDDAMSYSGPGAWTGLTGRLAYGGFTLPETVIFTPYDDLILGFDPGYATGDGTCRAYGYTATAVYDTGDGADKILCMTGNFYMGPGDDYVSSTDDGTGDVIDAGTGNDVIDVLGGGTDEVDPGTPEEPTEPPAAARTTALSGETTSGDLVCADRTDTIAGEAQVLIPTVATKVTETRRVWVKGHWKWVKVWNKAHTRKVWKRVWVKGHWVRKTVTVIRQVPAGASYTGAHPDACKATVDLTR